MITHILNKSIRNKSMNHHYFSTTQTQLTQHRKRSFVVTGPMLLELLSPPICMLICLVSDMRNHLYVRVYSYILNVKFGMIPCIRMSYFTSKKIGHENKS